MSIRTKFWIYLAAVFAVYLALMPIALENPRMLVLLEAAFVTQGFVFLLFRCPHCRTPIIKRRTTSHRFGYYWGPPIGKACTQCGEKL